jgi:CheY-like chemotaxis protein
MTDLEHREYARVAFDVTDGDDSEIPIGARLYAVLVRVLLDNAIEASEHADSLQVALDVQLKLMGGRTMLLAEVRDKGAGISPDVAGRLFDPNVSSKGEGRGLGLYLLRALAEEVGGGVELSSTPGEGTVAAFWLPAVTPQTAVATSQKLGEAAPVTSRLNGAQIVVVDDDSSFVVALNRALSMTGANVRVFTSAESALDVMREAERAPDCLVTDLMMPGMSGFDLIRSVRERWPRVPVIVISGYYYSSDLRGAMTQLERVTFLQKPFDTEWLFEQIFSAVRRA